MFDKLDDMLIHYEELMRMKSFSMSWENRE